MTAIFSQYSYGDMMLTNRIVMPPLGVVRADERGLCNPQAARWYSDRAAAGLIITEGTQISPRGRGNARSPGIHNAAQVASWQTVTDAVHNAGGRIFLQLWHCGRIGHVSLQPDHIAPIAPTDERASMSTSVVLDDRGVKVELACSAPVLMSPSDIERIRSEYLEAARNAKRARFDGVELHAAAGYLLDQFLNSKVNRVQGNYGPATPETRTRFLLEIVDCVATVFGPGRVGVRLSPFGRYHDMPDDPEVERTLTYLSAKLAERGVGHLHFFDQGTAEQPVIPRELVRGLRRSFRGTLILCGDYRTSDRACADIESGLADLIAFGKPFITNPDLPRRLRNGVLLEPWDPNPLNYMLGDEAGYPGLNG